LYFEVDVDGGSSPEMTMFQFNAKLMETAMVLFIGVSWFIFRQALLLVRPT
jgi:hypothetical protein